MFTYNLDGSIRNIRRKSGLRKAALAEWPTLAGSDLNNIHTEAELVIAIVRVAGGTEDDAIQAVRAWMERQGMAPAFEPDDVPREISNDNGIVRRGRPPS